MRITFHNSQMPNVICETNMMCEFNFWKNALLACVKTVRLAFIASGVKTNAFGFIA